MRARSSVWKVRVVLLAGWSLFGSDEEMIGFCLTEPLTDRCQVTPSQRCRKAALGGTRPFPSGSGWQVCSGSVTSFVHWFVIGDFSLKCRWKKIKKNGCSKCNWQVATGEVV